MKHFLIKPLFERIKNIYENTIKSIFELLK